MAAVGSACRPPAGCSTGAPRTGTGSASTAPAPTTSAPRSPTRSGCTACAVGSARSRPALARPTSPGSWTWPCNGPAEELRRDPLREPHAVVRDLEAVAGRVHPRGVELEHDRRPVTRADTPRGDRVRRQVDRVPAALVQAVDQDRRDPALRGAV